MNNFEKRKFLDYLEKLLPVTDTNSYEFDNVFDFMLTEFKMEHVTHADKNLRQDYVYNFVAYTFLGKIEGDGMHIHHITNDGYYNTTDYLILLTQDENSYIHGFKAGGINARNAHKQKKSIEEMFDRCFT